MSTSHFTQTNYNQLKARLIPAYTFYDTRFMKIWTSTRRVTTYSSVLKIAGNSLENGSAPKTNGENNMQLLQLEPGDYLVMMPGHMCPHASFSMADCLMTGSVFWNSTMLPQLLNSLPWICSNNAVVSNETIPRQPVDFFQALRRSSLAPDVEQVLD